MTEAVSDLQGVCNYFELRYGLPENLLANMMDFATQYDTVTPANPNLGPYALSPDFTTFVQQTFNFQFDPTDVIESSQAVAMFLNWAYNRFGAWDFALAAFNWSWTAVTGFITATGSGLKPQMPTATVNYIKAVAPEFYRGN